MIAALASPAIVVDASHGRLGGDVTVVAGLGATLGPATARAALDVRLRFLDSVGAFAIGESTLGSSTRAHAFCTGLELRPLFLGRWLKGLEFGAPTLDLLVDSLGLELGTYVEAPAASDAGGRPGAYLGLGAELPLFARPTGLWLAVHGGLRLGPRALGGADDERTPMLTLTLAWHHLLPTHVIDAGDLAPR
jgi:hypothetical protein